MRAGTAVSAKGANVRREHFGTEAPVGARLRLRNITCEVVGLLQSNRQAATVNDKDDIGVMSIAAVQRRLPRKHKRQKSHHRPMTTSRKNPLSPKKLLHTKWTAVTPLGKEKHFLVTRVVLPQPPVTRVDDVELQAVHTQRSFLLPWRELTDATRWRQGWV